MAYKKLILTDDHLTLLQNMNIDWDDCEYGAPCVNPKRPYGNGDVESDVCENLGWVKEGDDGHSPCWSSVQRNKAYWIHREMLSALQICLQLMTLETGVYESATGYQDWKKVG